MTALAGGDGVVGRSVIGVRAVVHNVRAAAAELQAWRKEIEQQRVKPHLRDLNATQGERAVLVCWMEVC